MSISLQNLAERLSLSVTTVSRCLSDHPDSSVQTRMRVKGLAAELGYTPDGRGRPRRKSNRVDCDPTSRTRQLGVIVRGGSRKAAMPNVTSRILDGLSGQARAAGASLHIHQVSVGDLDRLHEPEAQPVALANDELDGLVLVGQLPQRFTALVSEQLPCVSIVERSPGVSVDCIDHDDADSVSQLVDRLMADGHHRIGFISESQMRSVYAARYAGLVQTMVMRGLPVSPQDAINVQDRSEEIDVIAQRVAGRIATGVTAWVAVHDMVGYHVMEALRGLGLTAPEDYSLVGFDNLDPPHRSLKKLVSVEAPFEAMGQAAVRVLMRRFAQPRTEVLHSLFRCSLVEGRTVGPARPIA